MSTSPIFSVHLRVWVLIAPILIVLMGCGPTDYTTAIQDFSDASALVEGSATTYLNNANTVEQEASIEQLSFEGKPINFADIDKIIVITPDEIQTRMTAISILSAYTSDLATLASGNSGASLGQSITDLGSSLNKLSDDAKTLPHATFDNAKFTGVTSAAASAIGAVAKIIVDHRSRREIEESVQANEKPILELIDLIGDEMQMAYQRQKSTLGAHLLFLIEAYKTEQASPNSSPDRRLSIATKINKARKQVILLQSANPEASVAGMRSTFTALVAYSKDDKNPKTLAALWKSAQDFVASAQPLAQAIQALISAA